MPQSRKARIGVIGTGWWATYAHLPALNRRQDVEVVALADLEAGNLQTAARIFRVAKTYTSYREMLDRESLDGVVVSASHAAHYEAAKAGLEHDCHILAEKPLALSASNAEELIELAIRRRKAIVMSCPWGYTQHALRARAILQSGEIGDVRLVSSLFSSFAGETYKNNQQASDRIYSSGAFEETPIRARADANIDPKRGGGQGWCQVSHSAALCFWVTGLSARTVSAYMDRLDVAVDVVDAISMRLTNGAPAVLSSTGNIPVGDAGQHSLWIYGHSGYLVLDLIAGTLLVQKSGKALQTFGPLAPEDRYPRFAPANHFLDVILYNSENLGPGEVGCQAVQFLEAAYQSAANGGMPTDVPFRTLGLGTNPSRNAAERIEKSEIQSR